MTELVGGGASWYLGSLLDTLFTVLKSVFLVIGEIIKNRTWYTPWIVLNYIPFRDIEDTCYMFGNEQLPNNYTGSHCIPDEFVNYSNGVATINLPYTGTIIEIIFALLASFFVAFLLIKIVSWVVKK